MPNKIELDEIEPDESPIELDEMIELDEPEEEPGFFAKAIDIGKEFTAGVADVAKSWEAEHKRRGREAAGIVQQGYDMSSVSMRPEDYKRLSEKGVELRDAGLSQEEQTAKMFDFRAQLVRERAEEGAKGARRLQRAMPKPTLQDDAGFFEQAARGITRFGAPMLTTAISGPAGMVATFQAIRGAKIDELEKRKTQELKGVKDSWQIKEIENKYSEQSVMDNATLHSILSTPVEQFGTVFELGFLKNMLKGTRAGSRLTSFLTNMAKNSATEGFEEWVQTHTELIADTFQRMPDKSGSEVWTEVNDEFWTWKHQGKAAKGAALGMTGAAMMMGAPAGAVNIAQSIEEKAALSDLTSEQRGRLKANPLLTADDLRQEGKAPVGEKGPIVKAEAKKISGPFGALEEDVQVTDDSTAMAAGIGDRGVIILEEKLRTEAETIEAEKIAREQRKAALEVEKQEAAKIQEQNRKAAQEKAIEDQRKAALDAQEEFEMLISGRPGLINQSIQAVAALEKSGDPSFRKAAGPIRKAQQALVTREDSAKRLMTIQNDLQIELQRITDPRSQSLMMRLDGELEREVTRIDALVAAKEAEVEAKKVKPEPAKAVAVKKPAIPAVKKPAVKVPSQKYEEYKPRVAEAVAKGKIAKAERIAKTKAAIEKVRVRREIKEARVAEKKIKGTVAARKLAKTKAAIAAEKKKRDIRYMKTAGQVTADTVIAGQTFGNVLTRIKEAQPVRKTLSTMAKTQGKSFFIDVMHPSKIGARIYKQQRDQGITADVAKATAAKALQTYTPEYNEAAQRYLLIKTPAEAAFLRPAEMAEPAVPTEAIQKDVKESLKRASVHLKGITGIEVVHKSTDLKTINPVMYANMERAGTHGQANALFDPSTKSIYVFTENAQTSYQAKQAIWHELGHFSLGELLGADLDAVVQSTATTYPDKVSAKMSEGYPDETLAAEEVLIDMFTRNETNTAVQKFKNLWDRFIQKIGFTKGEVTEADVRNLVAKMRKRLMEGKVTPSEVQRIKKIATNGWKAQMQDLGTPQARHLIDKVKWTVAQDKDEFGTVNNRLQKELEVFEKLFGASDKASMMPGKLDVKTYKRPITRTITARDMGEELERVRKDGTLKRYLDPKVPAETIVTERGLKGKEKLHFLTELKDLRSGPLYIDDSVKIDKKVISSNDKAGMSLDFWLGTCQPTQPCKECYAASAYFRMSAVKKSFRNTAYILAEPKLWAKKVAAEIKAIPQTKIPFIRLLGSGDMTFSEQVKGFNELAKVADRPIHIFSRHHDNLRKLKGTKNVPFMKMGSIDTQLFDHYGIKYLEENTKLGIANAFLYTDKAELPKINKLIEKDSLGLVLSASTDLHKTLTPEAQASSCPCDAGERGAFGSCRMCAMSEAGCFMGFAAKGFDKNGKIWDLTNPKKPADTIPFTAFLKDVQDKTVMGKKAQAYSNIAVDSFSKSMTYTQTQILWFTQGKQADMKLKDTRFPNEVTKTKDVEAAKAWKENLSHMRDEARKGTFLLPSGEIQPTVEFKEGKPIRYDKAIFKIRREAAMAREAELAKFGPTRKAKKKPFRPGRIAFTKQDQIKRVQKLKAQVKDLIIGGIKTGAYTGAVRFAPIADINAVIKDGKVKIDLHCTPILGRDYDAIPAYGDNTKTPAAMVVEKQHMKPKPEAHTNEAYIKAGTPIEEITFIFPTDGKRANAVRVPAPKLKYSIKTPAFKKWFKKSVVKEEGEPIELYHGTTHEFTEFDPSAAYLENFLGRALYFTDNPVDASVNYGTLTGADITARINQAQEELETQLEEMNAEDIAEAWPELSTVDIDNLMDITTTEADLILKQLATQKIAGQNLGSIMPVYVRMERPLYLNGPKETQFSLEIDWDYYRDLAKARMDEDELMGTKEEIEMRISDAAQELYAEDADPMETGTIIDLKNAFFETADDWGGINAQDAWDGMREMTNFEEDIAASDLFFAIMEHTDLEELEDVEGILTGREFQREWIERAGYDGVILDASRQFPQMLEGQPVTTHYMPFKGIQVKSVFNMGKWSPAVADIRYSKAQLKSADFKTTAFKHPRTGKIYRGKPGGTHEQILVQYYGDVDNWPTFDDTEDMGYIDAADKFVTRRKAAKRLGEIYADSDIMREKEQLKYDLTADQQKAMDHIGLKEKGVPRDTNLLEMNWLERNVLTRMTDSLYAIAKMEKGKELADLSGYKSFNMLSNFPAMFSSFLNYGRVKFQDNWMVVSPEKDGGLFEIQKRLGEQADPFFKRLTAKSGQEILDRDAASVAAGKPSRFAEGVNLFGKDKTTGELLNDRKMVTDLLAGTVVEYRANKDLWDWTEGRLKELNTSVLDFAEKSNLVDPAARKKFEREYYVPFFRIMEDMETGEVDTMFPKPGDPVHISKIHRLTGSHKNVGDPFNNLVNNYSFVLHESLRNLARGKSLNLAKQMGLLEKTAKAGKQTIGIRVKGKESMYNVLDPLLYKALVDIDTVTNGWMSEGLGKWLLRKPKLWLTKFVTYDPSFRIANFVRDTLHTSFMQKGFIPVFSSLKGGYHALRQTDEFKEFASIGGAFTGAYHERDTMAKTAEEVARLKKRVKRAEHKAYNPIRWLDIYRQIGEASENAARMGVYMIQKKKGVTPFEAAYSAKDLLDFHRSGSSGFLSFLTQTVPFLNARIQGMYKLGRTAVDVKTRRNFWVMAAMLSAATTAYFFMGPGDDDRYKELTDADKMMYWHFYDVPGVGHLKIPKPFEIGAFFGSIPEAFMEYLNDQKDGKELASYVAKIFRDILRVDMPQSAKVIAQQWANKDYFTGAPIVPARQLGARPEVQYGAGTAKLARLIGAQIEKVVGNSPWASPRRIQKVFEDLFSYGTYTTSYLTDMMIQQTDLYPADPALADGEGFSRLILGTGRFVKGEAVPKYTKSQQQFYEMLHEANSAADTFRIYKRMKSRKAAMQFRKVHRKEIRIAKKLTRWQRKISKYNQKIDIIIASRKYTAQEKREKIDALILQRSKVFQRATAWGKEKLSD